MLCDKPDVDRVQYELVDGISSPVDAVLECIGIRLVTANLRTESSKAMP